MEIFFICGPIFEDIYYMMRINVKSFSLSAVFLLLMVTGCRKNIATTNRQLLLFEYDYISYATKYQHNGFIIDGEGNVFAFNNPDNWYFPDRELRISESQVAENLSKCTRTGIKIPAKELTKYSGLIKDIAATKVTAARNAADNKGSGEFRCYEYSENSAVYQGSLIKMEGDITCENLNFFSRKVVDWMKNINSRLTVR